MLLWQAITRDRVRQRADSKPSPWLPVWQASIRAVTTLARMLALSPGGRVPSKSAEAHEPVSYYERMSLLEGRRDDEPN
jgi:hypothetical protein